MRIRKIRPVLLLAISLALFIAIEFIGSDIKAQTLPDIHVIKNGNPKIESALLNTIKEYQSGTITTQQLIQRRVLDVKEGDMDKITVFIFSEAGKTADTIDKVALESYGVEIIKSLGSILVAKVPINTINQIADNVAGISFIQLPNRPQPQSVVQSEGVTSINAASYHSQGYKGKDIKVAIIDTGFAGLDSIRSIEFPTESYFIDCTGPTCVSVSDPFNMLGSSKHGTAVAEIIADVAPEASVYLIKISTIVDLWNAKDYCIQHGIKIINHSEGWPNTNFNDGKCWSSYGFTNPVCTVNDAYANGILWVNSAGNYAKRHYSGTFTHSSGNNYNWHDPLITINNVYAGRLISVALTWDAWPTTDQNYDLYLLDKDYQRVDQSDTPQAGSQPKERIDYTAQYTGVYFIGIYKRLATNNHSFKVFSENHDITPSVATGSLISPADASGAVAVGAADYKNYAIGSLADYSSQGPTTDGRIKPEIVAPASVSTYTYGVNGFPGTSAAAPHVAGAAALMLSKHPNYTLAQLWNSLTTVASNKNFIGYLDPFPNNFFGYGLLALPPTFTVLKAGTGTGTVVVSENGDVQKGFICGTECTKEYGSRPELTLCAGPDADSIFDGWSGGGLSGTGNCAKIVIDKDVTVTGTFTKPQYTVSLNKSGTGNGIVTSSPPGINCGSDCQEIYNPRTGVLLTATAGPNSIFKGWWYNGTDLGPGTTFNFIVNQDMNITAEFTDTTLPTGTIAINSNLTYTSSTSVSLTLSCSDVAGCSQMQFSNDNANWSSLESYATTKNWLLTSGDGTKTVYTRFKDNAGNRSSSTYSSSIILDTFAPATTASTLGGAYNTSQSITLTSDERATIYFTTDGSTPTTSSVIYALPIPITSTTTLKFFAKDVAGNSEAVKTENYIFDVTPPTGTITIKSNPDYTNSVSVTLSLSCTDITNCSQMQLSNDGSNWSSLESYATTKDWLLTEGDETKTVYVKFKDNAGNWSAPYTHIIKLDTVAPATTPSVPGGTYSTSRTITLSTSEGKRIYYTVDGSTPTINSNVYTSPIPITATTTLKYFAVDEAGNKESAKTEIYTIVHLLTVSKTGTGTGSVISNPSGIDCGSDCIENYISGTEVVLSATPSTDSIFSGWSGSWCSGKKGCTVLMDASKNITATFTPKPPFANGLVAYYSFNGDANDESGNGNDGILYGVTGINDRFGNENQAFRFDGNGNYIQINDSESLRPSYITISAWLYPVERKLMVFLGKSVFSSSQNEQYQCGIYENGFLTCGIKRNSNCTPGQGWYGVTDSKPMLLNKWSHIAVTWDGLTLKMYVNGVLADTNITIPAGGIDNCIGGELRIGEWWQGDPHPFHGNMDNFRIYDRALTDDEIHSLYDSESRGAFLTLSQGWSFVSFPRQPSDIAIEKVMVDISPNVRIVWGFDNQTKTWLKHKHYSLSPNINPLTSINTGNGYWIYMNEAATLDMTGWLASASKAISLYEDWNLIGYNGQDGKKVEDVTSTIDGKWVIIWGWENGRWYAKPAATSLLAVPLLTTLEQWKAYWIKMNTAQPVDWAQ